MTAAKALEAFAWALRGFQGMGLAPSPSEDSGGPWERLSPELRDKWLTYAAQVLHSATVLELPAVDIEATGRQLVFEGVAGGAEREELLRMRRYSTLLVDKLRQSDAGGECACFPYDTEIVPPERYR